MIKKTITYTDYNGVERIEDFFFNLTEAELVEWEYSVSGGLVATLRRIINEKDQVKLIEYFKKLVLKSYGVKSDDGRRFIKSQELSEEFSQTEAYVQIFMELAMDADAAAAFVNGITPKRLEDHLAPAA